MPLSLAGPALSPLFRGKDKKKKSKKSNKKSAGKPKLYETTGKTDLGV